jgi:uncharacterized MAPEG superfamily protein
MPRVSTCERTLDRRLEQRWSYANALLRSICGKEIGVTERGDNILVVSKTDALWGLPKLMQEERVDNTSSAEPIGLDLRRQQTATVVPIAVAFPVAIVLWFGTYYLLPPLAGMEDVVARLVFALKCSCVAILFCFVAGIEAVAHERLRSPAIDPLSGYDTPRMRVNLRYLQNTLEQLVPFVAGVFGLAVYCSDGRSMRAVAATTVVWIAARIAFWIGYHRSSAQRGIGAPGMVVSILVLLYVCARFGFEIAGTVGAIVPLVLFGGAEGVLFWTTRPPHL